MATAADDSGTINNDNNNAIVNSNCPSIAVTSDCTHVDPDIGGVGTIKNDNNNAIFVNSNPPSVTITTDRSTVPSEIEGGVSVNNDNNNAIFLNSTLPSVIVTTDCSPNDSAIAGAGDGEDYCCKSVACNDIIQNARVKQLIIDNCENSGLSDSDISGNNLSDNAYESDGACALGDFQEPDSELAEKIRNQVEFYFSDSNILKDTFLLKHVRRNKQGFVSLKLVTSFKKMKSFTKDYRVVAHSLRESEKVIVNEEGTKVRRVEPLPDYDETIPSRTVVVVNIPSDNPTVDSIAEIFGKCGDITQIRILRPGKPIPQDVKKFMIKHPEIGTTICAIVEFESYQGAKEACETLSDLNNWRGGMRVLMLSVKRKDNNSKAQQQLPKDARVYSTNFSRKPKKSSQFARVERSGGCGKYSSGSENDLSRLEISPDKSASAFSSTRQSASTSGGGGGSRNQQRRYNHNSPSKYKLAAVSADSSPRSSPETRRRQNYECQSGGDNASSPTSPWLKRRLNVQDSTGGYGSRRYGDGAMPARMSDMSGVVRQPRGPDGSLGFSPVGRGRGMIPFVEA